MKTQMTSHSKIIFDLECNGLKPDKIWCIAAKELNGQTYTYGPEDIESGIAFLSEADTLIGHNIISFDIPIIENLYGVDLIKEVPNIEDTLVMSRLFNPVREGGHSLEKWGYKVGSLKKEKPLDWNIFDPKMIPYCIQDTRINEAVYLALLEEGKYFSKESIEIEHEVSKILDTQERNGFYFNEQKAMELLASLKQRMKEVEEEVHEVFKPRWVDDKKVTPYIKKDGTLSKRGLTDEEFKSGIIKPFVRKKLQEFNLGSRKQIGECLQEFGWKPARFTPTGQPIIDEGTLNKVKHIPEAKLIAEFLLLQKRTAQIGSWLDELKGDRIHGRVISTGTITSRMSHRNPNTAQIPSVKSPYGKECRSCWTVPKEYKLVGIDASGLEIRMLAHYMNDEEYINEIINGDIHSRNQQIAGLKSRDQAKTFIYCLIYGGGNAKLGAVVGGSKASGKKLRERFFDNQPAFKTLRDRVNRAAKRKYLKGIDGRKIFVRYEHASLNTLLQGGGAIVMKKALMLLNNKAKARNLDYKFVANVHDEWQVEVHSAHAEYFGKLGVESIQEAGEHFKLRCPLTGEYKVGDNWYETH